MASRLNCMEPLLKYPTETDLHKSLVGNGIGYKTDLVPICHSSIATYYNCKIEIYGEVTLKICHYTTNNSEQFKSFKRSHDLYHKHKALSVVVEPKFYFKFENYKICFIYEQFTPFEHFDLEADGIGSASSGKLSEEQLTKLKEILTCMRFLNDKGGHGNLNNKSVCSVVNCRGKMMLSDLKPLKQDQTTFKDDYQNLGHYLKEVAISSWKPDNKIPKDLSFLITQLTQVIDGNVYRYYDEHPLFYSHRKKLVLFMFGHTEGNVFMANASHDISFDEKLQNNLTMLGSKPSGTRIYLEEGGETYSWWVHRDIFDVYDFDRRYKFSEAVEYLRFVRNIYVHILNKSQLNKDERQPLFENLDRMWPGFVFALFVTLAQMDLLLDG